MIGIDRSRDRSKYTNQARMIKLKDGTIQKIRVNGTLIRPVMLQRMEEYYDKMTNVWGRTTDEQDEQLCREGNELINEYLRARPEISNRDNVLIGWANTVSSLLDRCRWNECRPKQNITNEPARMSFQDKVMRQWNRMKQRQINQPKRAVEGNEMRIIANINDYRGID